MNYLPHIPRSTAAALALALAACGDRQQGTEDAEQAVSEESEAATTPPTSVAPAPDEEQSALKNWMLIEETTVLAEFEKFTLLDVTTEEQRPCIDVVESLEEDGVIKLVAEFIKQAAGVVVVSRAPRHSCVHRLIVC